MSNNTGTAYVSWQKEIDEKGAFIRKPRTFRNWISSKPGSEFTPEKGRYHLYVSFACPWAHRTLLLRKLKGLEDVISYDVVDHFLDRSTGWSLLRRSPDTNGDTVNGFQYIKEAYLKANPEYVGSYTVPVLWDKKTGTIVNNESSEIIRMLNFEFNHLAKYPERNFYPEELHSKIEEVNEWIYPNINDGVYRSGFAKSQEAYETACNALFNALDRVEEILSKSRYLAGDTLTEADIRLWPTLIRFDAVYFGHFKTNKKHIYEYPNIWNYTLEIYQMDGVAQTVNMYHIKHHYYESHKDINPFGVVPLGGVKDFTAPHNRDTLFPKKSN